MVPLGLTFLYLHVFHFVLFYFIFLCFLFIFVDCSTTVDDMCYVVVTSSLSWDDAQLYCSERGGTLAVICGEEVNEQLKDLSVGKYCLSTCFIYKTCFTDERSLCKEIYDIRENSLDGCMFFFFFKNKLVNNPCDVLH